MQTVYALAGTASPPSIQENWESIMDYINYYLERGLRFC